MPINPNDLSNSSLFKYLWTSNDSGLAHRGLDEVTPEGVTNLKKYALEHNADGTAASADSQVIDATEREAMLAILQHDHYGAFVELDARPLLLEAFGIDPGSYTAPPVAHHPVDAGTVATSAGASKIPESRLRNADPAKLPEIFENEYKKRRADFESTSIPAAERAERSLGLLASYAKALWANGESEQTEAAGHALLDAFEKLPYASVLGSKDFNGAGWSVAQSLVLGLDPNEFVTKYPDAFPTAETTYLAMNNAMATAMGYVDKYLVAQGAKPTAEAFELKSPLGFLIGEESGHYKQGNLSEETPFSSSGLNWGTVLFRGDDEIAKLPPKKGFEFPIDCLDGIGNFVIAEKSDKLVIRGPDGATLKVEKQIQTNSDGKPESWSAKFLDAAGNEVPPANVVGVITGPSGKAKGDGKAAGSQNMWWWGFCDRNTAQRLYKSKFQIPQLDVENIKIKAGNTVIEIPKAEAQKLLDADIPDVVTGETYCGFRFNDEPQYVALKNGDTLRGRVSELSLEAGPGTRRMAGDYIAVHDAPGRPMLGTIEIAGHTLQVAMIENMTLDPASNQVTVKMKDGWPDVVTGELKTAVKWDAAQIVEGKKVITQDSTFPVRGEFAVDLVDGTSRRIPAGEISQIVGETQKELRLSQYMVWVSQNRGMYATDSSTGEVVSNGMRWANKIDIEERTQDERPNWASEGDLSGIEGPINRQPGDKILWVRGLYAYQKDSDATSDAFSGWVQVSKSGRILNEGFLGGQPDFGWAASGPLNWEAKSSFNPYMPPELRLAVLVNGVSDLATLQARAKDLNLPENWKSYRVDP